jgi:hypothetical protein
MQYFHDYMVASYDFSTANNSFPNPEERVYQSLRGQPSREISGLDPNSVPAATLTKVRNRAISKFLTACQEARSSFEAGQDLGEWKETIRSCIHPMQNLRDYTLSYFTTLKRKRGRTRGRKPLRKVLSDTYLEYTFGWKPLALDVAAAVAKLGQPRFDIVPVHANAFDIHSGQSVVTQNGFTTSIPLLISSQTRGEVSIRYKGGIKTNADASGHVSRYQDLQLLPRNWLPTAYDLLPYSWIADYFTNIGEIIQAACFVTGDLSWGLSTYRSVAHFKSAPHSIKDFDAPVGTHVLRNIKSLSGGNFRAHNSIFSRARLTAAELIPDFEVKIPLSAKPWENLGALLVSRGKSLIPFF